MFPKPQIGSLAVHVLPPSALIALSATEYVTVYSGSRMRPLGKTVGLQRTCQPMRLFSFSFILERTWELNAASRMLGSLLAPSSSSVSVIFSTNRLGASGIAACQFHFGGP